MSQLRENEDLHLGQTQEWERAGGVQLVVSTRNLDSGDVVRVGVAGGPPAGLDIEDAVALRDEFTAIITKAQEGIPRQL